MWCRGGALVLVLAGASQPAYGLEIRSHYSPLNRERPERSRTDYIVLHTTEGASRGALTKLRRAGEAHYLVDERGRVTRIIHHRRIATHAGMALWDGHRDLDRRSLAIEVAGYHHRRPSSRQIAALRELLTQLQGMYRIPDDRVLTHSMVAYGTPHKYHPYPHRGRKRCGMIFADRGLRRSLGLTDAPDHDPDVRARRVRVADRELFARLFPSSSSSARSAPRPRVRPEPEVAATDGLWSALSARARGLLEGSPQAPSMPRSRSERTASKARELVHVTRSGRSARHWVGTPNDHPHTIYLFPSGLVRTGADLRRDRDGRDLLQSLPSGTRVLLHKQFGGYVTAGRPPAEAAGPRWDDPGTLYRLPDGGLVRGHRLDAARVPRHTLVFPPS